MLQELIVYLIGIAVTMLLISKVYKALFGKKDQKTYGIELEFNFVFV